jgi:hypothetical protein
MAASACSFVQRVRCGDVNRVDPWGSQQRREPGDHAAIRSARANARALSGDEPATLTTWQHAECVSASQKSAAMPPVPTTPQRSGGHHGSTVKA